MRKPSRGLWIVVFGLPVLLAGTLALATRSLFQPGMIEVRVVERAPDRVSVGARLPAVLVPLAMYFVPDGALDELRAELDALPEGAIEACRRALGVLARGPDGVLVDVRTETETVLLGIRDGRFELSVETPSESVNASVPVRTVGCFLDAL